MEISMVYFIIPLVSGFFLYPGWGGMLSLSLGFNNLTGYALRSIVLNEFHW